jgi:hypothetical protein
MLCDLRPTCHLGGTLICEELIIIMEVKVLGHLIGEEISHLLLAI